MQEEIDLTSNLNHNKLYWIKPELNKEWQPAIWDSAKKRFKRSYGGYVSLYHVYKVDLIEIKHKRNINRTEIGKFII